MRIRIEFLDLPMITDELGKQSFETDFEGQTLSDLVEELAFGVGRFRESLLEEDGRLKHYVLVCINGNDWVEPEKIAKTTVQAGDTITFMLLLSGG